MGAYFSSGIMGMKKWLILTILGFASVTQAALPAPELSGSIKSVNRNPRLFYVSSTTSTSFATTRCYIASATVACKRKRRNLVSDELDSQLNSKEANVERDAKMMLYWVTTTTTTTSYTATSTLATLQCIPGGWEMSACG